MIIKTKNQRTIHCQQDEYNTVVVSNYEEEKNKIFIKI